MDPTFPLVTIANISGLLLVLSLFLVKAHKLWGIGTIIYAIALIANCLVKGISPAIWNDNVRNSAPIWCDISTRLMIASEFAIPCCSLSIARYLYRITKFKDLNRSASRRFDYFFDSSICIGVPLTVVALYYTVQPNRYTIKEEIGCVGETFPTGFTALLAVGVPFVLSVMPALFYCPLSVWFFYRKRLEMNRYLAEGNGVSRDHYLRVLALALVTTIQSSFMLVEAILTFAAVVKILPKLPFWPPRTIHANWSFIPVELKSEWANNAGSVFGVRWEEWNGSLFSVVFFLIYGLTEKSRERFSDCFWTLGSLFGRQRPVKEPNAITGVVFTSFEAHPPDFSLSSSQDELDEECEKEEGPKTTNVLP